MATKQTGANSPPLRDDPSERITVPPSSQVAPNEAGRKEDWLSLLDKVKPSMAGDFTELAGVCKGARKLTQHVGKLALQSLTILSNADRSEIIQAATERFLRTSAAYPTRPDNPERLFLHAIRYEVVTLTRRRFEELSRGLTSLDEATPELRILSLLSQARERATALPKLQQRVLRLTLALDSIGPALGDDKTHGKMLPILIGLALGLRVNSVHQHQTRIRKKLFAGRAADIDVELGDALRYLWQPPFALAYQSLVFVAAYQTHAGGAASLRLHNAKEAYAERFKELRDLSEQARYAWHDLAVALDASGKKPRDVHAELHSRCKELRIDDRLWVLNPTKKLTLPGQPKSPEQTWASLLLDHDGKRPIGAWRDAWRSFLFEHITSPDVLSRWSMFEERSQKADAARTAVGSAYQALLDDAKQYEDIVNTIENLKQLLGV